MISSNRLNTLFGAEQTHRLLSQFPRSAKGSYSFLFRQYLFQQKSDNIKKKTSGRKLVELGAGKQYKNHLNNILGDGYFDLDCSNYIGLDPSYKQGLTGYFNEKAVEITPCDGLSYLLEQQDNSCNVMSLGVFAKGVLEPETETQEYLERLINEIYRVTFDDGISMHITDFPELFEQNFKLIECDPSLKVYLFEKK